MRIVSENEYTAASIKADLEQLYAAASYVNADGAEIDVVVQLIAAAILELDGATAANPPLNLRLVQSDD